MSADKKVALCLLAGLVFLTLSQTYARLGLTVWMGRYQQAVVKYDRDGLPLLLAAFIGLLFLLVSIGVLRNFLNTTLALRWRTWLTRRLLDDWLSHTGFYRIEQAQLVDNPDQRITEDIDQFVMTTLTLSFGLFETIASAAVFLKVLWAKSGNISIGLFGGYMNLPHYMVWFAAIYSVLTSVVVQVLGRRLKSLTFRRQQAEASFRFMMAGVRAHAEQIALLGGSREEVERLTEAYGAVRQNIWQTILFNLRFEPVTLALALVSTVVAEFVLLPRYLAHGISYGDMVQLSSSFGLAVGSLQWFAVNFTNVQQYRVIVTRLQGLKEAIGGGVTSRGPRYVRQPKALISTHSLTLATPQGHELARNIDLLVRPGQRWVVTGPSGSGKSTLLRCLAGIWHYGSGVVTMPVGSKVFILPQRSYLPNGSLKGALCYPQPADAFNDDICDAMLADCGLAHLRTALHSTDRWDARLSPGEQQRLGFARALLQRPDFLMLDESTSALDEENERRMYELIVERLPKAAVISVSHHRALYSFHTHSIEMSAVGPPRVSLMGCGPGHYLMEQI
ncbi:hypothetical protein AN416_37845 (plasmid) [Paraburkholderia caribensis]|nr:hypothetical protein AN416_37845 [Paraburkholderia caribensis]